MEHRVRTSNLQTLRLGIFTRRFWPYCGPTEMETAELAGAMTKAGQHVEILTIRWEKNWPKSFQFRELDVTRINRPVGGPWGMFRFLRRLNRHVKDARLDGLIVYGLTDESWATLRNFARKLPVVVRLDGQSDHSSPRRSFNSRQLAILRTVRRIVVDSAETVEQLINQFAIGRELFSIVPPSVRIDREIDRTAARQGIARSGLSDAHPILQIDPIQPLVVCASLQFGDRGMLDLIDAWPLVLDQYPIARLWILGDGLKARSIWERICELNLANSIVMPGFFDDLEEVLLATDVYVHPLQGNFSCGSLMRALTTGTCTVATTNSITANLIQKNTNGMLVPTMNPPALAEAICLALNDDQLRKRLGMAARQGTVTEFDIDRTVRHFLVPFSSISSIPAPTR